MRFTQELMLISINNAYHYLVEDQDIASAIAELESWAEKYDREYSCNEPVDQEEWKLSSRWANRHQED